jgi:hypothetical protein
MMTKANILLSLADELKEYKNEIYLPVYMTDTLLVTEDPKMKTIRVPVTEDEEFHIPLKAVIEDIDLDKFFDDLTATATQAAKSKDMKSKALEGLKKTLFKDLSFKEIHYWRSNFNLMVKLIKANKDTVWNFILKNAYKPAYLRNHKVDYITGNPPWLAYRYIKDKNYKKRIKQLTLDYNLLEGKDVKLFTHMDTSTLFFEFCRENFLKKTGAIAFVLPKTTILPSKQHGNFQKIGFSKIHDFTGVSPLFNVRSVLLIKEKNVDLTAKIPITFYEGKLPRKNLDLNSASFHLSIFEDKWDFIQPSGESHYYNKFLQGATIVPRCFWFVQLDKTAKLNIEEPFLETSEEAFAEAKKDWKFKINGRVEKEFLFETVLSKGLFPFSVLKTELIFIPLFANKEKPYMVNSEALIAEGKLKASDWMNTVEGLWRDFSKSPDISLITWLNYRSKIIIQNIKSPYILLYNTSGTNLTAALYIKKNTEGDALVPIGFIADAKTYYYYPKTITEGDYLCAMLNSNLVNKLIKDFQPEGLFGPRDIHRRPFEVCAIPEYDSRNDNHKNLAKLGKICRLKVEKFSKNIKGRLGIVRTGIRKLLKEELSQIDKLVSSELKDQGQKVTVRPKKKKKSFNKDLFEL